MPAKQIRSLLHNKSLSPHQIFAATAVIILVLFGHRLSDIIFFRYNVSSLDVALASLGGLLALVSLPRLQQFHWLCLAWLGWTLLSISWSLSPAMSMRAGMWHAIYTAALLIASATPRLSLIALATLHAIIILRGVDTLVITERADFSGIWYQQNVQGGQLLLFVPLLMHWTLQKQRWSLFLAVFVGFCIFLSLLTFSTASQILLIIGIVTVWVWQREKIKYHQTVKVIFLLALGLGLGWFVTQPQTAQVFGVSFGDTSRVARVSDLTNTLLARVHMLEDVGRRAIAALPLGTGAGSLRDIYSHLQRHDIESVDAHNYYLQTLLTLGIVGIALLVSLFVTVLYSAYKARHAGLFVSLFLFMGYLAFDVMAYFPGIMVLFFATLGSTHGLNNKSSATNSATDRLASDWPRYVVAALFVVLPLVWWWWLQPCDDIECFANRKLADPVVMRDVIGTLNMEERLEWLSIGKTRYPETLFYARLYADTQKTREETPQRQVTLYRDIAERFPAADVNIYRDWRDAAIRAGDFAEALQASHASLRYFSEANALALTP